MQTPVFRVKVALRYLFKLSETDADRFTFQVETCASFLTLNTLEGFLKRGERAGTACCNTANWFYDRILWLYATGENLKKIRSEGSSIQTIVKIFFKSKIPKYHQFLLSSMNIYWVSLSSLILNWIFLDCWPDRTKHLNTFDKLWAFVFIFPTFYW